MRLKRYKSLLSLWLSNAYLFCVVLNNSANWFRLQILQIISNPMFFNKFKMGYQLVSGRVHSRIQLSEHCINTMFQCWQPSSNWTILWQIRFLLFGLLIGLERSLLSLLAWFLGKNWNCFLIHFIDFLLLYKFKYIYQNS